MAQQKQYGLIVPGKAKAAGALPSTSKPKNIFAGDSSGEEESNVDWVKQSLKKQSHGSMQQKESMKVMKKALEDDPSVYEYDEVYDDMAKKKEEVKEKQRGDRKSKYIEGLLKTAKQRELENELRQEREAQKEREAEGDMYGDKEAFVTSAYKNKMAEVRKMQEEQAYQDNVDDMTEVTKQKDMAGFYRYLYREKMKDETGTEEPETTATTTKTKETEVSSKEDQSTNSERVEEKASRANSESPSRHQSAHASRVKESDQEGRKYSDSRNRKRSRSRSHERDRRRMLETSKNKRDSNRDRERSRSREKHAPRRYDRDRHDRRKRSRSRSRGRDRDRDERQRSPDRTRYSDRHRREEKDRRPDNQSRRRPSENSEATDDKIKIIQKENWYDFDVEIERDVKTSFYAKRTVGKVFEDALQRYLSRKGSSTILIYNK